MAVLNDAALDAHGEAGPRPLAACALALGVTVLLLFGLLAPLAYWYYGWAGVLAVAVAGLLCGFTGFVALWVGRLCQVQGQAVSGVLVAMGIRMGVPLMICLVLAVRGSAASLAGFVYYLLVFYLATLAVETWYSLPSGTAIRPSQASK